MSKPKPRVEEARPEFIYGEAVALLHSANRYGGISLLRRFDANDEHFAEQVAILDALYAAARAFVAAENAAKKPAKGKK